MTKIFIMNSNGQHTHPSSFILHPFLFILILLIGCLDAVPDKPPRDNPWDPENSNPPRAPSQLRARSLSETTVLLTWRDQSGNEDGFLIYEKIGDEASPHQVCESKPHIEKYLDSLVLENRPSLEDTLAYYIESFNKAGSSQYRTGPAFASTLKAPPLPPSDLQANVISDSTILLTWIDHSAVEEYFEIEQSIGTTTNFLLFRIVPADCTSYEIGELNPDVLYFFQVRAVNIRGISTYTEVVGVKTGDN